MAINRTEELAIVRALLHLLERSAPGTGVHKKEYGETVRTLEELRLDLECGDRAEKDPTDV